MYGAGECFAYGASGCPAARRRAEAAFQALRFLSEVTQGGSHPAPAGFPARSILPTSGPNPNAVHYTPELDRRKQQKDPLWKVITPRWPTSADNEWYWKCDTSSDELDGHYFLYALYYDLVAETPEQREQVRAVVRRITDHLIDHGFELVDHDGRPTRWARYSPQVLNGDILENGRGLNSLSMLSYLKVAEHLTGDRKYREAYNELVDEHFYATNVLHPKQCDGPGTGNQSDDEMAFMCYYNLLTYETDPELRAKYLRSLRWYWRVVERECNPMFTFIYVHSDRSVLEAPERTERLQAYLAEAVDSLQRLPLDRAMWPYQHSHRIDIQRIPAGLARAGSRRGCLRSGKVIPVDERSFEHWNHDPWRLDGGGDGRTLGDGAVFLLPYWMGRFHGFIEEQQDTEEDARSAAGN